MSEETKKPAEEQTNKAEYMNIIPDTAYISNLVSELDSRISALEAK